MFRRDVPLSTRAKPERDWIDLEPAAPTVGSQFRAERPEQPRGQRVDLPTAKTAPVIRALSSRAAEATGCIKGRTIGSMMADVRRALLLVCLCCLGVTACGRPPVSVLLVTFDTTRWDHVGYSSGRHGLTPTLDALAERGTWFETTTASAPITLPSHATILTGLEPYRHGVRNNGTYNLSESVTTLAECLTDRGYRTHAVVSAFVLDSRFGLDQGFAGYDDDLTGAPKESAFSSREITAERTAAKTLRWLRESEGRTEPFFLWVHFFDPHAGYEPPPEYLARVPDDPYTAEIVYADAMLGRVIAELERQRISEDTLVVFLSDHGESLGEHGERTHGIFIYDATIRVPLLLAGPGVTPGLRVGTLARSVDVMPTILDLIDAPIPTGLDGRSLRSAMAGDGVAPAAYVESLMPRLNYGWSELRGLRTETIKTILAPAPEVFDLVADPDELTNLVGATNGPSAEARALLGELRGLETTDPFSLGGHVEADIEDETRDALEALGYTRADGVIGTPGTADPKDRIAEFETLGRARELIDDNSLVEARTILIELISSSPANMDAMLALAHVHVELGEPAEALSIYERALKVNPNHRHIVGGMVPLLIDRGEIDRAERLLLETLVAIPDSLSLQIALGRLYQDSGRMDRAESSYRKALATDPSAAEAVLGLAGCLEQRGAHEAAAEILTRAYENNQPDPEIVERLARLSNSRGENERSIELYRQLVLLEPDNPSAWNNLAALLAGLHRYPEAAEAAQRAYELDRVTPEIRANLGMMLILAGRFQEGLDHLEVVLPQMPDDTFGASVRAQALEDLGRTDQALAAWKEIATRDPGAGIHVARLELERQDEDAARKALTEAINRGGDAIRTRAGRYPELEELVSEIP